jgi:hypothetical protein
MSGALISFLQIKQVESTQVAYYQAIANLEEIRIWWHALPEEERAKAENKENLVEST